jgi:hypothetical protein
MDIREKERKNTTESFSLSVISFPFGREEEARPGIRIRIGKKKDRRSFSLPTGEDSRPGRITATDGVEAAHFSRTMRLSGGLPARGGGGGGGLEQEEAVFFGSVAPRRWGEEEGGRRERQR